MVSLFRSFFYFTTSIFLKKKYDIIFYYPKHFNRGIKKENYYFSSLINSCKRHNITYLLFEEPDSYLIANRNKSTIPFDFIFYLIIFLRKLFNTEVNLIFKDNKIGIFLSKTFFRGIKFNNVITISQSMVSVFRGIDSSCSIFDVQHGIIHPNKLNYLEHRMPSDNLINNRINILLTGLAYQELLVRHDSTSFFKNNSFVIGSHICSSEIRHFSFNNKILVTLQFTHDHTYDENLLILTNLIKMIKNSDVKNVFYLRNHPRYNNDINLDDLFALANVCVAPNDLNECFNICSLHLTAYSTCIFEAALIGIPTILITPIDRFNYFQTYFKYPFQYEIKDFIIDNYYVDQAQVVQNWAIDFYSRYDEDTFIQLLK